MFNNKSLGTVNTAVIFGGFQSFQCLRNQQNGPQWNPASVMYYKPLKVTKITNLKIRFISSSLVHSVPPLCFQLRQLSHLERHCFSERVPTRSATAAHDTPCVTMSPGSVLVSSCTTSASLFSSFSVHFPEREKSPPA